MKLVRRLTLYLLVAVGIVFGLDTLLSVRSHLALFAADVQHDEKVFGVAIARSVERAWQHEGEGEAFDLLAAMDLPGDDVRFRIVHLGAPRGDPFAPDAPGRALAAIRRDRVLVHVRDEDEPEPHLFTYVPLDVPGDDAVALEITESLQHEREYALSRVRKTLLTGALAALACGAVAWVVGVRVVGRPVHALIEKARRIGRGDFSAPLAFRPRDEMSQLATEMNSMAAALDAATQKVARESEARVRALEQLRHADRLTTVGKLAAGLAHELGTPLNVVAGRAKMIASGDVESAEEGRDSARIIAEQAERMTRIVRQLLDFARRRASEKRDTDLVALARQTAGLLDALAGKRRVSLRCEEPAVPVHATVDAAQVQQALANLVVNAVQASPNGSCVTISLTSHAEAPRERAEAEPGPWATIEVHDEGSGIPAEQMTEIFDPFFTTKPVGEGTGLGLSVAHGIAHEHGGWIAVQSQVGGGSRFTLWLPQSPA